MLYNWKNSKRIIEMTEHNNSSSSSSNTHASLHSLCMVGAAMPSWYTTTPGVMSVTTLQAHTKMFATEHYTGHLKLRFPVTPPCYLCDAVLPPPLKGSIIGTISQETPGSWAFGTALSQFSTFSWRKPFACSENYLFILSFSVYVRHTSFSLAVRTIYQFMFSLVVFWWAGGSKATRHCIFQTDVQRNCARDIPWNYYSLYQ